MKRAAIGFVAILVLGGGVLGWLLWSGEKKAVESSPATVAESGPATTTVPTTPTAIHPANAPPAVARPTPATVPAPAGAPRFLGPPESWASATVEQALAAAEGSSVGEERGNAVTFLGEHATVELYERIQKIRLSDPDPRVRRDAANAASVLRERVANERQR